MTAIVPSQRYEEEEEHASVRYDFRLVPDLPGVVEVSRLELDLNGVKMMSDQWCYLSETALAELVRFMEEVRGES